MHHQRLLQFCLLALGKNLDVHINVKEDLSALEPVKWSCLTFPNTGRLYIEILHRNLLPLFFTTFIVQDFGNKTNAQRNKNFNQPTNSPHVALSLSCTTAPVTPSNLTQHSSAKQTNQCQDVRDSSFYSYFRVTLPCCSSLTFTTSGHLRESSMCREIIQPKHFCKRT